MANAKAIKAKIKSIKNIQKITSALEIVSTVKLQKVKTQADNFKEYMKEFLYILGNLGLDKVFNFDLNGIKADKELIVVVSSEKGLCGALNSKLFRKIYFDIESKKDNVDIFCIGKKSLEYFTRLNYNIVGVENLKDNFSESDLNSIFSIISKSLDEKKYRSIKLYYNYFKNTMVQNPASLSLFPLTKEEFLSFANDIELDVNIADSKNEEGAVLIEPSNEEYYTFVYKKFISDMLYGAVLQNKAGEHASRMIAMKNAKDNSIDIQKSLTVTYNKQRQASVTQEISEIVGAKAAMEG